MYLPMRQDRASNSNQNNSKPKQGWAKNETPPKKFNNSIWKCEYVINIRYCAHCASHTYHLYKCECVGIGDSRLSHLKQCAYNIIKRWFRKLSASAFSHVKKTIFCTSNEAKMFWLLISHSTNNRLSRKHRPKKEEEKNWAHTEMYGEKKSKTFSHSNIV